MTKVLIGVNVAMFLVTVLAAATLGTENVIRVLLGQSQDLPLYQWFAMVPDATRWDLEGYVVSGVANGEFWRLVTAGFLHYGILHLGLNMYMLWILGRQVEDLTGRWMFLAVYLMSGLGGTVAAYTFGATNAALAGASGSVFGLLGALVFFFRRMKVSLGGLTSIIVINVIFSFVVPGISILGHFGGLIVGAASGALLAYAPSGPHRRTIQIIGLAVLTLALLGVVGVRTLQLA